MIKTALVTSLFNMHFPPAALIGCLTTVVAFKRSFKRNMSDNCRRYLNQILMLWNSSKENVQKRWKVAMVKFALHEYFSWKYAKQCRKHFLNFRNKRLKHYKIWLLKTLRSQYWYIDGARCNAINHIGSPAAGEISSDLYGLSGCDILNLTFCRLDFHQLLIKIS